MTLTNGFVMLSRVQLILKAICSGCRSSECTTIFKRMHPEHKSKAERQTDNSSIRTRTGYQMDFKSDPDVHMQNSTCLESLYHEPGKATEST